MSGFDPTSMPLEGTQLIEASAGTGKTYTIATLFTRLVAEHGLDVGEILVVTYTDAAAAELADRIRDRLREAAIAADALCEGRPSPAVESVVTALLDAAAERGDLETVRDRLQAALYEIDDRAISTIHGFCQRALQENAFESGAAFDLELVGVDHDLVTDVAWDEWVRALHGASPGFVDALRTWVVGGEKLGPERIARLIELAGPDPDLPVGIAAEGPPLDASREAWLEAARAAAEIHAEQGAEIVEVITGCSDLNKGSYRDSRVRKDLPALMERIRRASAPGLSKGDVGVVEVMSTGTMKPKKGCAEPEHPFFDAMAELRDAHTAWQQAQAGAVGLFLADVLRRGREGLARRKSELGLLFFDDLLRDLAIALRGETGERLAERLRDRYAVALIDEFQDTDPLQYEIFHGVWGAAGRPLLLVGDPKQAIYGFRGADVFAYLRARRDSGTEPKTLGTNYRSDPGLIEAVNGLFAGAQRPFLLDDIEFEPVAARDAAVARVTGGQTGSDAPFQILRLEDKPDGKAWAKGQASKQAAKATATDIAALLRTGTEIDARPARPGDIAVLCRSHAQAGLMKRALAEWGVAAIERADRSVFETREAEEIEWVLRGLLAGNDLRRVRAALGTRLVGMSARQIADLEDDEIAWDELLSRFSTWRVLFEERGVVVALERLFEAFEFVPRALRVEGGARSVTDVEHVIEVLHEASVKERLGPEALVAWLSRQRLDPGSRNHSDREAIQIRLESDANAVQLMTVHRSKGLEFPVVYCPFLFDTSLPRRLDREWTRTHDVEAEDAVVFDLGSDRHEALLEQADLEGIAEGLRLVYVALTRARHRCVVVWGHVMGMHESPLAYLFHQADGDAEAVPVLDWLRACRERVGLGPKRKGRIDSAGIDVDLDAICQRAPTAIERRTAVIGEPELSSGGGEDTEASLSALTASRSLGFHRRTSSFSGLVSEGAARHEGGAALPAALDVHPSEEGLDHDVLAPGADEAVIDDEPSAPDGDQPVALADFPAGAAVGTALHSALEELDFEHVGDEDERERVRAALTRHGIAPGWIETFIDALPAIVGAPLDDGQPGLQLDAIPKSARVDELEFIVPAASGVSAVPVTPAALADVFETHAVASWAPVYVDRLRRLDFLPLEGFLKGFVDLVFRWGDRWHVVDYKSNQLGARVADYSAARLQHAMVEHDYILQYHLYVMALHRQLGWRIDGYDYDSHIGDVYYLFLRGLSAGHPVGTGVAADRPPRALIEALSSLFDGDPIAAGAS